MSDTNKVKRVIGAIVGDIVGSVYEFANHKSKDFPLFSSKCFPTDDSIMTLGVALALMESRDDDYKSLFENTVKSLRSVGRPYPSCGYGGRFLIWMYSDNPEPYNSYGNGAAMRVSPVAYAASSLEEVKNLSHSVTSVTHNHPEGLKGAEATAVGAWMALNGFGKYEICSYIENNYYNLDFTPDEIRSTYHFSEACMDTVPQAIVCFRESNDFEDAIRNAISIGGDSDTIAAITGAVAAAYYGVPENIEEEAGRFLNEELTGILDRFIDFYG